jgi:hypothetical protein
LKSGIPEIQVNERRTEKCENSIFHIALSTLTIHPTSGWHP